MLDKWFPLIDTELNTLLRQSCNGMLSWVSADSSGVVSDTVTLSLRGK